MEFSLDVPEEVLRQERAKTRELRQSQWWKNRIGQGKCYYCGAQVPPKELTLDHIVPLVRGGKTSRGNCVPACKACNSQKQSLLPMEWEEFLQRQGCGQ